jgi:hypothetical protein
MSTTSETDATVAILMRRLGLANERLAELERENARLREALKPFASVADAPFAQHYAAEDTVGIKLGDLRRARAALAGSVEKN